MGELKPQTGRGARCAALPVAEPAASPDGQPRRAANARWRRRCYNKREVPLQKMRGPGGSCCTCKPSADVCEWPISGLQCSAT